MTSLEMGSSTGLLGNSDTNKAIHLFSGRHPAPGKADLMLMRVINEKYGLSLLHWYLSRFVQPPLKQRVLGKKQHVHGCPVNKS